MDKQQARDIVKGTLERPFDKGRFTPFCQKFLNEIVNRKKPALLSGQLFPDAYKQYITSLERIGKFNDGEHKIDILIVNSKKKHLLIELVRINAILLPVISTATTAVRTEKKQL